MPTIDQLAPATATSDTDEVIVNQTGITRRATRAQLMAGLQAELTLPSGSLLGRSSAGIGLIETLTVGANLSLNAGTLTAVAGNYLVAQSSTGTVPVAADLVAMGQAGANTAVTVSELASGIFALPGLNGSNLIVQSVGNTNGMSLASFAAGAISDAGGTMTGALILAGNPVAPLAAATKAYVDSVTGGFLPLAGGSLTGPLSLGANPSAPFDAATKQYVDSQAAGAAALPLSGGTLTGPLILTSGPTAADQAVTKGYVDAAASASLPLSGGTLAGELTLTQSPVLPGHATSKAYVDAAVSQSITFGGGTLTGPLVLASDPTLSLQAATKEYVDAVSLRTLPLVGGTLSGELTLSGNPQQALQAATKQYVDSQMAGPAALPLSGGTLSGPLILPADPTAALDAATKHYVDAAVSGALPLSGGTVTGPLALLSAPTGSLSAVPRQYVDQIAANSLSLSGGTMTGEIVLPAAPGIALAAANKGYVDSGLAAVLPLGGGTLTGQLVLSSDPSASLGAATKAYVDAHVSAVLPLMGGSLSGALLLAGAPVQTLQAATKGYTDAALTSALPIAGGSMTGELFLSGPPVAPYSAATKAYADSVGSGLVPFAGGTLTGPLDLAADPIAPLQAATKQYVDAASSRALTISGGTLTGGLVVPEMVVGGTISVVGTVAAAGLTVGQIGLQTTTLTSELGLSRNGSGPYDAPVINSNVVVSHSGGSGRSYSNVTLNTTVNDAINTSGAFVDGTLSDVYAFVSNLNVNSVTGSGATPTDSQHVAITGAATKKAPAGGYLAGRTGAQIWGLWLPVVDGTNLPSTTSGATTGVELDANANHLDLNNSRKSFQYVLNEAQSLTAGGFPAEWAYGIYFTTSATSFYKFQISAGGNYSIAVLDTRNAFPGSGKVVSSLTAPSTALHVDPALPFTSAGVYGLPVSPTNAAQIRVGSGTYTQVGFSADGPGLTSGVLTFTTPVSVADGVSGTQVVGDSRTIWMATGQQIALDYGGNANFFFDVNASGPRITASLYVDGMLSAPSGITAGSLVASGTTEIAGMLTAAGGLEVTGKYLTIPTYTVASLPGAPNGSVAYASNGRKPWEAAGSGTGVLVWVSTNRWLSTLTGTQVLA